MKSSLSMVKYQDQQLCPVNEQAKKNIEQLTGFFDSDILTIYAQTQTGELQNMEMNLTLFELCLIVSGGLAFVGTMLGNLRHQVISYSLSAVALMVGLGDELDGTLAYMVVPLVLLGFYLSLWNWRVSPRQWQKRWVNLLVCLGLGILLLWHVLQSLPHFQQLLGNVSTPSAEIVNDEGLWLFIAFNVISGVFWLTKGSLHRGN